MGRPVVAPVMDGEILYLGTPASGGMLVLDRIAAGDLRLAGVGIGFAQPVEENMPLCRLPSLLPDRTQHIHHAGMHRKGPDDGILAVVKPDRSLLHIDALDTPRELQCRLAAWAMEGAQGDDRLDVWRVGRDQPVAILRAADG